jgi:putative tricarboxylic transport membrane protein
MDARRVYQIAGGVILAAAAAVAYASLQLRYFTSLGPGPGFFPLWLSLALGGLALAMIVDASLHRRGPLADDLVPDRPGGLRVIAVVAVLAGTAAGLNRLGFAVTMFLATMIVLAALGRRRPLGMLAVAVPCSFGAYYVFTRWLNVPLPAGPFGLPFGL